jgi:hypothetical protein
MKDATSRDRVAFSGDAANHRDQDRGDDAQRDGGDHAGKQPLRVTIKGLAIIARPAITAVVWVKVSAMRPFHPK